MARSSGRSAPSRPAARAPAPAARSPPPPAQTHASHPPAPQQQSGGGSMLGNLGATMAQGMAFGAGSEVAHRAIGSMFGGSGGGHHAAPAAAPAAPVQSSSVVTGACAYDHQALTSCLQGANAANCDFYFQALQQCQANSAN